MHIRPLRHLPCRASPRLKNFIMYFQLVTLNSSSTATSFAASRLLLNGTAVKARAHGTGPLIPLLRTPQKLIRVQGTCGRPAELASCTSFVAEDGTSRRSKPECWARQPKPAPHGLAPGGGSRTRSARRAVRSIAMDLELLRLHVA